MTEEFHELVNVSEIADAAALTIPRAKALFDSVVQQRDYTVVQLLQHSAGDVPTLECLVVEVECDGVPPKNTQEVLPMDVLSRNDTAAARKQSGIPKEGPSGVLIGAGSLGSAMLNLWGRAGWGQWTVIDKDHVKPHNLSRHVAYAQHIGDPKATVVADLHAAAMHGANEVTALNLDASDFKQSVLTDALTAATLVVDASTTLEYPRRQRGRCIRPALLRLHHTRWQRRGAARGGCVAVTMPAHIGSAVLPRSDPRSLGKGSPCRQRKLVLERRELP